MNAITSRLDALRTRKKEIERSRKRISTGGSSELTDLNLSPQESQDKDNDSKPLSPTSRDSLIEKHQEPGTQHLPVKGKAKANESSGNNSSNNSNSNNNNSNNPGTGADAPPPPYRTNWQMPSDELPSWNAF